MITLVLPTFRWFAFRCLPCSLQAPWGVGMQGTHYVLRGDEYDVRIQGAGEATTGRHSVLLATKQQRQRGGQRGPEPLDLQHPVSLKWKEPSEHVLLPISEEK